MMKNVIKKIFKHKRIVLAIVVAVGGLILWRSLATLKKNQPTYQTAAAEKGTLITTVSGTGSITSGNNTNLDTRVSGVVKQVYVTNGEGKK